MNVLSLFDGMSCGQIALNRAGVKYDNYYASEIDKYAIKVTQQNYPNTIQLGDVTQFETWDIDWSSIGLVTGGFPCQAWSLAGKQLGDKDERGQLFWVMLEVIKKVLKHNPEAKFLMENVKMKKEFEQYITFHTEQALGKVNKHLINSALVSAQNRNRYYWTNIGGISQPEDKKIYLKDILESGEVDRDKSHCLDANYFKGGNLTSYFEKHRRQLVFMKQTPRGFNKGFEKEVEKCPTISTSSFQHNNFVSEDGLQYRKLTPLECERLQTVASFSYDIEVNTCLDQAKNFVDAVNKNPKLQKLVSNVERLELQEFVNYVIFNTQLSNPLTKGIVQRNVDTQTQKKTKECTEVNQKEQNINVNTVENTIINNYPRKEESFVTQNVFINITEGRIIHFGKEECLQKEQKYTHQKNGKLVLNLSGKEIMQNVEDVRSVLEKLITNNSTYTTLNHLDSKNIEQILIICYYYAKSVIDGYIQNKIQKNNLLMTVTNGYTACVSNSQRYKMLGNGWTVDVIVHIFKGLL